MKCMDLFNANQDNLTATSKFVTKTICQEIDRQNLDLKEMTVDQYVNVLINALSDSILNTRNCRYAISSIFFLYKVSNIAPTKEIANLDIETLSLKVCEKIGTLGFFKNIESVIAHVRQLSWGDFSADAEAVYVLAWHGIDIDEMIKITKQDIDFSNKKIKTEKHGIITFSPFEFEIIEHYFNLAFFKTPIQGRTIYLVTSNYLFRPCESRAKDNNLLKMTSGGLSTKLKKINDGLADNNFLPRISTKRLMLNGDFYRVYVTGLSKFVFDKNRQIQYQQYKAQFWENEG